MARVRFVLPLPNDLSSAEIEETVRAHESFEKLPQWQSGKEADRGARSLS